MARAWIERRERAKGSSYRVRVEDHAGRTRTIGTWRLRREADAELVKAQAELARGAWVDLSQAKTVTFAQWVERYEAEAHHRRPTTIARDTAVLRRWWLPALGKHRLATIEPADIRAVVDEMRRAGLAPATIRTHAGVVRGVLSAAVSADVLARSPYRGVKLPGADHDEPRFLAAEELHRLAAAMPERYRAMPWIAAGAGLRWSEVVALRRQDVNVEAATVVVGRTLHEVEGRLVAEDRTKTRGSRATLPLPGIVVERLAEHLALDPGAEPSAPLFTAPRGGPVREANFRTRTWAKAVEEAKLDGLTFHQLRHSLAGWLIAAGAHPQVVKARMRHSSIRVTFDVYGHLFPALGEEATAALDATLRSHSAPIPPPPAQE